MNKTTILSSTLICLCLACGREDEKPFSKSDVRSAQRIVGIEFNDVEIDTLYDYLVRNRKGYDSLRAHEIDFSITPALYFDPRPLGFQARFDDSGRIDIPQDEEIERPSSNEELAFLPVHKLAKLIETKQVSSVELTRLYLNRLKEFGDTLEAVITLTEERAMMKARKADSLIKVGEYRGPLHGIPYGLKDLVAVEGYPTTWGANPYKDQHIDQTATIVKKLDQAGAVLVAKLTSGALARGDVWFGGKTRNPWDLEQGASGSSAGSGSAMSAGLVAFAIGTETLGSIISPSTRNGVTGLRPTYGVVSRDGVMSLSWSMDKVGPICRDALDCALVFQVIKGSDQLEKTSEVQYPFSFTPKGDLGKYKIGFFKHLFETDSSDSGKNNERTLAELRDLGADLEELKLPEELPFEVFDIILRSEAGAFFDELVRQHQDRLMVQQQKSSRANSLRQSRFIPAVEYLQANRFRNVLIEKFYEITRDYDLIVSPTFGRRQLLVTNLTGNPAISLPTGLDDEGHPTSITFIGNLYDEKSILEAAAIFQSATDYDEMHPPIFYKQEVENR